jgi:hypothetical protein
MIGYTRWTGIEGGLLCESEVITIWQDIADCVDNGERIEGGILCESAVITVWQDIADSLDNGERIDGIIIEFLKDFYLVHYERLPKKTVIWAWIWW